MLPVKPDGIDGAAGPITKSCDIPHLLQLAPYPGRRRITQKNMPGTGTPVLQSFTAQAKPKLVGIDIGRIGGLLYGHTKLHDIEKELQKVLMLSMTALHPKTKEGLAILQCQAGGQGHTGPFV